MPYKPVGADETGHFPPRVTTMLNNTYERVFKPEAYGTIGAGNDAPAINAAITAAVGVGGGRVVFGPNNYSVATKISLPATSGVTLVMDPRGSITATAAMSAVIEKPAGASTGPITLDGLNVDGASLASAALSVLQSNRLTVIGGVYKNGTVATVDIGNTGLQNYEMEWRGGKVIGRDNTAGKTKADRPAFAFRLGAGCTDNVVADVKVKNALTMVQDNGQANVFHLVHAYPYPVTGNPVGNTDDWADGTVGFHAKGNFGSFLDCYADTLETGFKAEGFFNEIASPRLLWAGGYTPTNPVVGVDLLSASNYVHDGNFNGTYAGTGAIGIRVAATAYRVGITNNQFQGSFNGHTNPVKYLSSEWGHRWGNEWDLGSMTDSTQNKRADLINIERGDANDILLQWGKGNPGRMIALGTGATGYIRMQQTTAGSGWQLGGPGEKVGFAGKTPAAPSTLTYARNLESASGAALRGALSGVGLVTDSTVGGTPPASTYLYPLAPTATATSNALGNDVFRAAPALLPAISITKVGAEVTVAGSTGCTVRLGIYADNGNYAPGSLILDAGTIPGDAVGVAEITLGSTAVLPAGYYWLGAVVQGTPATQPTLRTLSGNNVPPGFILGAGTSTPSAGQSMVGVGQVSVTGALPATLPSPGGSGAAPVRLFLKLA